MCVIIAHLGDDTERVDKSILKQARINNPHGMGIMWANKGKLHIFRSMTDFRGLWSRYCTARTLGAPTAVHFRYRTKGPKDVENCHPFVIEEDQRGPIWAMMHNGTIAELGDLPDGSGDSKYFVDTIIKNLPPSFIDSTPMRNMLGKFLEAANNKNKLLFMDREGGMSAIHEGLGHWNEGKNIWFSSWNYLKPKPKVEKKWAGSSKTTYYGNDNRWRAVPEGRRACYRCKEEGHWPKDCPLLDIPTKPVIEKVTENGSKITLYNDGGKKYCCKCWEKGHKEADCPGRDDKYIETELEKLKDDVIEVEVADANPFSTMSIVAEGVLYDGRVICNHCLPDNINLTLMEHLYDPDWSDVFCRICRTRLTENDIVGTETKDVTRPLLKEDEGF